MSARSTPTAAATHHGAAFEAIVIAVVDDATARVRPVARGKARTRSLKARLAVPSYRCAAGDRVVAIEGAAGEAFVVGVLRAAQPLVVATPEGASASVEEASILVRDPSGAVVVVYDAARGEARIVADRGDLALSAPSGRVVISAGLDVELRGGESVKIGAPEVECTAARATLHTTEAAISADRVRVSAEELVALVGRYELRAQRLFHKAIDAYYDVDGLLQTRAGQLRSVVKGAIRMFAKRTSVVSEEDTFIDGKRVLLG